MCPAFLMWDNQLSLPAIGLLVKVSLVAFFYFLEISADSLRGRVFNISLGDLNNNAHDQAWRKIKLQVEEIKGFDCYTNFHGMDITRDKLCSLVKKWHSLIEAFV